MLPALGILPSWVEVTSTGDDLIASPLRAYPAVGVIGGDVFNRFGAKSALEGDLSGARFTNRFFAAAFLFERGLPTRVFYLASFGFCDFLSSEAVGNDSKRMTAGVL